MKTFVIALSLLAPDGTQTQVPIELWKFDSMLACVRSSTFLGQTRNVAAQNYKCVEYGPRPANDIAKAPKPALVQRAS